MPRRLFFFFLLIFAGPVLAAGERLLFWEVETDRSRIYLLGSMHLARPDIYPLRAEIMAAFERSDSLAVEVDIGGANELEIQQRMLQRGTYPAGESIQDELSPATWRELAERLRQNGLPPMLMERMKPGLVVTSLTTVEMMKLGLSPEQGVDRFFLARARGEKPILELETIDRQLDILLDFPEPELLVRQTLLQLEGMEQMMNELVSSWKQGDGARLQKLVIDDELAAHPEFRVIHRRMFDDRNREMTRRILGMQQRGGNYFVVVGAGHLVGDEGIIALLRRRGQAPRQL